jgi:hypothetical protein
MVATLLATSRMFRSSAQARLEATSPPNPLIHERRDPSASPDPRVGAERGSDPRVPLGTHTGPLAGSKGAGAPG